MREWICIGTVDDAPGFGRNIRTILLDMDCKARVRGYGDGRIWVRGSRRATQIAAALVAGARLEQQRNAAGQFATL